MRKAQLLKGVLEGCILQIISRGESYGYVITEELNSSGFPDLNEGSVYPVLIRLENKELVNSESRKSELGPKRKYFNITASGMDQLNEFKSLWKELSGTVDNILFGGSENEFTE